MHARRAGEKGQNRVENVSFAAFLGTVKMKELAYGVFRLRRIRVQFVEVLGRNPLNLTLQSAATITLKPKNLKSFVTKCATFVLHRGSHSIFTRVVDLVPIKERNRCPRALPRSQVLTCS